MIIDCQTHIYPQTYVSSLLRRTDCPRIQREANGKLYVIQTWATKDCPAPAPNPRPINEAFYNVKERLKLMDNQGVDVNVVSLPPPWVDYLEAEEAVEMAKAVNDDISQFVGEAPERLVGLAVLPYVSPAEAVDELVRAVEDLGLRGAVMGSNVRGFVPDLNLYLPIFEKASKLNIPICLHPTVPSRAPAYLDEELNTAVSWMFDTTFTLAKLLVGGLLEKVPDLKLVAHHLGGATLALLGRIDYYLKTDLKVKAILTKPPSEYYKQVYYDTLCHNVTQTTFAYSVFETNKLLFASDSPFHSDISECLKTIELADIPEEGKKKILEDNARELFGI